MKDFFEDLGKRLANLHQQGQRGVGRLHDFSGRLHRDERSPGNRAARTPDHRQISGMTIPRQQGGRVPRTCPQPEPQLPRY